MKQKIYHGAPISALPTILQHGIVPRSLEHEGSWPGEPSTEGFVYLTKSHPIWYATAPTCEDEAVILELNLSDLPVCRRYADEDYLAQETWYGGKHQDDPDWSLDIRKQQSLWRDSMKKIGNIAVEGVIAPTVIRRYAIIKNDFDIWEQWISRRIDRQIGYYQAQKADLRAGLSYIFDKTPGLHRLSRRDFNVFYSHKNPEDRDILWETAQAVQVVTITSQSVFPK